MAQNYNYKGALQEHFAKNGSGITPEYGLIRRDGADHTPTFVCYVRIGKKQAEGTARAKKDAEQEAARHMLQELGLVQRHMPSLSSPITKATNNYNQER